MMQITTYTWIIAVALLLSSITLQADTPEGNQILDGIGETALVARYCFDGDTQDWTRNNLHAELVGDGASFVDDKQFGKVLLLPKENDGTYIKLPGNTLNGLDSLSITGWVYMDNLNSWQRFFDIGSGTDKYFYCTPVGEERDTGCRLRITSSGYGSEQGPSTFRVATKKWVHIAAVLDSKKNMLLLYVDGTKVGQTSNTRCNLSEVLDHSNPDNNHMYLGKSVYAEDNYFSGKLYDVRFYSIALDGKQVAGIYKNALSGEDVDISSEETSDSKPEQVYSTHQLVNGLIGVEDCKVTTSIGQLPELPFYLKGKYENNMKGPDIRVIWPSPKNNEAVSKEGVYTITGFIPGTDLAPKATVTVIPASEKQIDSKPDLCAFNLGDVILEKDTQGHKTPFIKNRDKFINTLAETDPDSFLFNFRDAFGQPQPEGVRPLGVWDSRSCRLRGHASGHYLTALAQAYSSTTYDEKLHKIFHDKMEYMVNELYRLSQMSGKPAKAGDDCVSDSTKVPFGVGKDSYDSDLSKEGIRTDYWNWGEGFISGYPPDQFIMLEKGATYGSSNRQIWAPYYTLHKILAGLLDCYEVAGNDKALQVAKGMGSWVYNRLKVVPTETRIKMWNRYIAGEYGGMNEAMARLYRITKEKQYLECARLFDNIDFFFGNADHQHGLACNVDTIRGKHANQHIPQIIGALETFQGVGDNSYYEVAENFWNICTHCYMYSIGGVAGAKNPNNAECFTAQPNTLYQYGFSPSGQNETCATYNMLKLSRGLFMYDQDARYMDYYEQALYNHILASVDKDNPGNTYHVPLNPGSRKHFGNAHMNGFTCCNGTAIESSTKLQDTIYLHATDNSSLYVNLYVPSVLNWSDKGMVIRQETSMPYADTSKFTFTGTPGKFAVNLRVPKWASSGITVKVNGKDQTVKAESGSYVTLNRKWNSGDTIDVKIPMDFHLCQVMDQPNIASIFYGPVLLTVQEPESRSTWRKVTLKEKDIASSFKGDPSTLTFEIDGVTLKPFYDTYGYHSVYVDVTME